MKTLKEMNMGELRKKYIEWRDLYLKYPQSEMCKNNAEAVEKEYHSRIAKSESINKIEINVFYEEGYRWSVQLTNEEESRDSYLTKVEAMQLARTIRKNEFNGKIKINEEKMTKKQRKDNIEWLRENTDLYVQEERF